MSNSQLQKAASDFALEVQSAIKALPINTKEKLWEAHQDFMETMEYDGRYEEVPAEFLGIIWDAIYAALDEGI